MTVALSERLAGAEILSLACDAAHDHQTANPSLQSIPDVVDAADQIKSLLILPMLSFLFNLCGGLGPAAGGIII